MTSAEPVTIRDIAKACGCGVTTVSRALNNQAGVSTVTRARILAVAEELNYTPNLNAKNLRSTSSEFIAVIVKGPRNPFFLQVLDVLEYQFKANGYRMGLVRVGHEEDELMAGMSTCSGYKPAGLVFLGGGSNHSKKALQSVPVPFVLCTVPPTSRELRDAASYVVVDGIQGIDEIVGHLVALGHEKIAFLRPQTDDNSVGMIRCEAFQRALQARGLRVDPGLICGGDRTLPAYSLEYGYLLTKKLLSTGRSFTALVCMSDVLGIGAMKALQEAGLEIPRDVSVTGFDGIDIAQYVYPSLTTYAQPVERIAESTASILLQHVAGDPIKQHLILPGTLRMGGSTGPVITDKG